MLTKHMSGHCRSVILSVLFLMFFCSAVAIAAECSSGCSCLLPADAKAKEYGPCGGQLSVCGYDRYQNTMYCYKTSLSIPVQTLQRIYVVTTTTQPQGTCPVGCSCMLESNAREKFGTYSRCSETPCATIVTGSTALKAYCFRQGTITTMTTVPPCPEGCSCISEATAEAKGGSWKQCSERVCGYEQSTGTFAAVINVPKYCMMQQSTTPVCPQGCTCLSDEKAKARYGDYIRCSAEVCGKEVIQPPDGLAAYSVPQYCVKQAATTPICSQGCYCLPEAEARLKFGPNNYTRCSADICGFDPSATTANGIPRYCFKPAVTVTPAPPVCPEGCYCLPEAEARLKFGPNNYTRCSSDICGYDPSTTTANGIAKYCFKPTGAVTPTSAVCPEGCTCITNGTAVEKGLTFCGGTLTSCGYDENKLPLYCFGQNPSPTCSYDYQKNVCTGACPDGYTCGLLASKKDGAGKVVYAVCGCTGQPATPCIYDAQKNACTGTCQTGAACSVVGKKVDDKTGETLVVCGCLQQSSCTYNYDKEACVGTCMVSGENCQLNTIYRDPSTGKVTFAECHCKVGEVTEACACDAASGSCTGNCASGRACTLVGRTTDNAGKVVCSTCECRETCVLTANSECSGTCADQQPCTRIVNRDNSGNEKVSCGCGGSPQVTPAVAVTPQPGILETIASFFSKLFGGK